MTDDDDPLSFDLDDLARKLGLPALPEWTFVLDANDFAHPEPNVYRWSQWMERSQKDGSRIVAQDRIGDVFVSTVFLGLSFDGDLWETMIFGGPHDQYQRRYQSKHDAERGHTFALQLATGDKTHDDDPEDAA